MLFFQEITTLEELKKEYHLLAMLHHPDMGGDLETMQMINAEFDRLFPLLKNKHKDKDGDIFESDRSAQETPDEFTAGIDALFALQMKDVIIEIIGAFVWLTGGTKPYKDDISKLGFTFAGVEKAWYLKPVWYKKRSRKQYNLENIRSIYGSQTVTQEDKHAIVIEK